VVRAEEEKEEEEVRPGVVVEEEEEVLVEGRGWRAMLWVGGRKGGR